MASRRKRVSTFPVPTHDDEDTSHRSIASQRVRSGVYLEMQKKWLWTRFVDRLRALAPLKYDKSSRYVQEWEKSNEPSIKSQQQANYLLRHSDALYIAVICLTLAGYCLMLWLQTVKEVFLIDQVPLGVKIAWVLLILLDAITQLHTCKLVDTTEIINLSDIREIYFGGAAKFDLANIIIAVVMFFFEPGQLFSICCTVVSLYTLAHKISEKYQHFKSYSTDVAMLHEFKILQLFVFMLFMGHLFVPSDKTQSILLYEAGVLSFQLGWKDNWVTKNEIDNSAWHTRYVYSLYWAITTITTVGYGDIHGTNEIEFLASIVVEIIGAALVGYMINVIGMTLNDMKYPICQVRKAHQELEDDTLILKKLTKAFSLSRTLSYRIQTHIQNTHMARSAITVQEEQRFFEKLDPRLRYGTGVDYTEVFHDTNMKIVQKNTFLLMQFTRNFRDQIAAKLIKKVFQPNETLEGTADFGLFVVDRGSVEILYHKKHNNKVISKVVRTIRDGWHRTGSNVYGVAQIVGGKKLCLSAKSKTFTIAYELKKSDFMEAVQSNPLDTERFCELKDKVCFLECPQAFEGDLLLNFKEHYVPNKFLVVRKHNFSPVQQRRKYQRYGRKLQNDFSMINGSIASISIEDEIQPESQPALRSKNVLIIGSMKRDLIPVEPQRHPIRRERDGHERDLDAIRQFENYFPKGNFNSVMNKYYLWLLHRSLD